MRIVLDTNIFVSALISQHGPPAELFDRWNDDEYELVTAEPQIDELRRVLTYPRVAKHLRSGAAETLIGRLYDAALFVADLPEINLSDDPDDNIILAIAVASNTDLIASGDKKHMLLLDNVQGIPILAPAAAIAMIASKR